MTMLRICVKELCCNSTYITILFCIGLVNQTKHIIYYVKADILWKCYKFASKSYAVILHISQYCFLLIWFGKLYVITIAKIDIESKLQIAKKYCLLLPSYLLLSSASLRTIKSSGNKVEQYFFAIYSYN